MHIINDNLLTISLIINRWMNQQRVKEEVDLKQDLCPAPSTARTHACQASRPRSHACWNGPHPYCYLGGGPAAPGAVETETSPLLQCKPLCSFLCLPVIKRLFLSILESSLTQASYRQGINNNNKLWIVCGECAFKGQVIQMVKTGLAPEPTFMARKGRSF